MKSDVEWTCKYL
uniref:Uncharacterized protein n=1 Tax=Anguilla anguilla TaxID=7936 RepID=A0A0E9VCK4_ANGAN